MICDLILGRVRHRLRHLVNVVYFAYANVVSNRDMTRQHFHV